MRHYLDIMAARLGDRLRHTRSRSTHGAAAPAFPPGLLLTLVENAIEHGISPALRGGTVRDRRVGRRPVVVAERRDDGVGLAHGWAEGIGLRNCRERLRHMFGPGASLSLRRSTARTVATVRIAAVTETP